MGGVMEFDSEAPVRAPGFGEEEDGPAEKKRRLSDEQVQFLEDSFTYDTRLEPERKHKLAGELGIPPKQVSTWFQNKRARMKTKLLESEHMSLMRKYKEVIKENQNLRTQVEALNAELMKEDTSEGRHSAESDVDLEETPHSPGSTSQLQPAGLEQNLLAALLGVSEATAILRQVGAAVGATSGPALPDLADLPVQEPVPLSSQQDMDALGIPAPGQKSPQLLPCFLGGVNTQGLVLSNWVKALDLQQQQERWQGAQAEPAANVMLQAESLDASSLWGWPC